MKGANGILVIVVGLLVLWLGVTGKFCCFSGTLTCLMSADGCAPGSGTGAQQTGAISSSGSSALDRVAAKVGGQYTFPGFGQVLSATPPIA